MRGTERQGYTCILLSIRLQTCCRRVQVLASLGVPLGKRVCTFMFGAHALTMDPQETWLPSSWVCIVCSGGSKLSAQPVALSTSPRPRPPVVIPARLLHNRLAAPPSAASATRLPTHRRRQRYRVCCGLNCSSMVCIRSVDAPVYAASSGYLPPNFISAPGDAFVPDIVAASDCVLGKIGYGTVSECLVGRCPLIFVRRCGLRS